MWYEKSTVLVLGVSEFKTSLLLTEVSLSMNRGSRAKFLYIVYFTYREVSGLSAESQVHGNLPDPFHVLPHTSMLRRDSQLDWFLIIPVDEFFTLLLCPCNTSSSMFRARINPIFRFKDSLQPETHPT